MGFGCGGDDDHDEVDRVDWKFIQWTEGPSHGSQG